VTGRIRRRVLVSGRVQGVFFRDACRHVARREQVAGWVRNRADGRVEACFEGEEDRVARMVAWCRQGPPQAHVRDVEVFDEAPENAAGFFIR
jgi:acylphosphatase